MLRIVERSSAGSGSAAGTAAGSSFGRQLDVDSDLLAGDDEDVRRDLEAARRPLRYMAAAVE
jgi:hypothetical protein